MVKNLLLKNNMKTIKEKILSLPKSKEYLITKSYADMVWINVWEEYNDMWYELDEIQDHVYNELIRKWYIKEHREMMREYHQNFNEYLQATQEYLDLVSQHEYEEMVEEIMSK